MEGLNFDTNTSGSIAPPLFRPEGEGLETGDLGPGEIGPEAYNLRQGKVPLNPALVRGPVSAGGRVAAELSGYPGFTFTEDELNALGEVWAECGMSVNPVVQAIGATMGIVVVKMMGYGAWKRSGKPGDLKELKQAQETTT